jgi:hypothetical protein
MHSLQKPHSTMFFFPSLKQQILINIRQISIANYRLHPLNKNELWFEMTTDVHTSEMLTKYDINLNFSLKLTDKNRISLQVTIVPSLDVSLLKFKAPNLKIVRQPAGKLWSGVPVSSASRRGRRPRFHSASTMWRVTPIPRCFLGKEGGFDSLAFPRRWGRLDSAVIPRR